jgi:hypothetical protein
MIPEQAQLLLANLNRAAAILRDQHLVADADAGLHPVAILVVRAGADGDDFGFVELLDGGLGEEDARGGFGFGLEALDEDAVEERGNGADGFDGGLWYMSICGSSYCGEAAEKRKNCCYRRRGSYRSSNWQNLPFWRIG